LRQRYIRDVADDTCAKSYPRQRYIRDVADDWKCLALWVIDRQRGEVNGMHVCKYGNLMRQEANNELQLQLHCNYTNNNVKII